MSAAAAETTFADDDVGAMLRKSVQDFCLRHSGVARTRALRESQPGYDSAIWQQMAEAGWTGIGLPEESGGLGLGLGEICIVAEELAADLSPEPFAAASIAALTIAGSDNTALGEALMASIVSGALIPAFAWQEKANTLDILNPATRLADAGGGQLVLTGGKRFVPAATGAGGFAITAATPAGPVVVWLDATAQGITLHSDLNVDGSYLHTLRLNAVELTEADILVSAEASRTLLPRLLDQAIVIASAELLGIIRTAFELTRTYVGQRSQFGKPIGSFQVLQHRLVDLWMQRELVRACLEEAIDACGQPDAPRRALAASAVKARASAAALLNGRQSIQLHGAIGYADEHDIGVYLKRAIVKSAWLGNAPAHRQRFAALSGFGRNAATGKD